MTDAARDQAIDALGRAVGRVMELGVSSHPLAENLMGGLEAGRLSLRLIVEVKSEMVVRIEAVPVGPGEALEVLRIDPPPRGPPSSLN